MYRDNLLVYIFLGGDLEQKPPNSSLNKKKIKIVFYIWNKEKMVYVRNGSCYLLIFVLSLCTLFKMVFLLLGIR